MSRGITDLSNSDWYKDAYHPDGSVKSEGSRIAYGAALAAIGVAGALCDLVLNVLAIASIYFAGKKIWENAYSDGAAAANSQNAVATTTSDSFSRLQAESAQLRTEIQYMQYTLSEIRTDVSAIRYRNSSFE